MADQKYPAPADLPQLAIAELPDGGWCIASAHPERPLTEQEADSVLVHYQAMAEILLAEGKKRRID